MDNKAHAIASILPGSIADEMGIEPGDKLIAINHSNVVDVLDYLEWIEQDYLELTLQKKDGEEWILEIEKDADEDLGIDFETPLMDKKKSCANNCIFCFVDQLPSSSRCSLQFKDDDWRLSFLMGNYITLTNLSPLDLKRIQEKRISPLYVSIHTTNPELRMKMMRNKRAGEILEILKGFRSSGISVHCQIVLCRNVNDGGELEKTLEDLWAFRDIVQSIAVVPVGLTGHREGLENILPFDKESSNRVIDQVERWQTYYKDKIGTALVFIADEFYVMADRSMPDYDAYEGFPQIENGVGLVQKFRNEFSEAIEGLKDGLSDKEQLSIVTGQSAAEIMKDVGQILEKTTGKTIYVYPIQNNFFGGKVSVAGLITGSDIIKGLKDKPLGQKVLIPDIMLRQGEDVFLDDMSLEELSRELGVKVVPVPVEGRALVEEVLLSL